MHPSRYVHMFPKQRDLMGFDEVRHCFPVGDHSCSSVYLLREKGKEIIHRSGFRSGTNTKSYSLTGNSLTVVLHHHQDPRGEIFWTVTYADEHECDKTDRCFAWIYGLYRLIKRSLPEQIKRSADGFDSALAFEVVLLSLILRLVCLLSHRKRTAPGLRNLPFSAISTRLFCPTSECDCCVRISPNKRVFGGKRSQFRNEPGVKTSWETRFDFSQPTWYSQRPWNKHCILFYIITIL